MASNCNKYLEPTGVVLGKSTRVLGKVTLTTDGTYDSTKEYDRISLVYDPNTYISYISKQHVPAGTALSDTEYWQPLNSAILGPGQSLNGVLNMLNSLNIPNESSFLHYNEDTNQLEWTDVAELIEIINNYFDNPDPDNPDPQNPFDFLLKEPLKSINSLNTSATQAGQMLIYNGTQWKLDKIVNIPTALGEPLKSIANLGTPSGTNKIIMYKNGSWSYQDASSMNLGNLLTHINTKNAPVPTTAGYLYYNGSAYSWMPGTGGLTNLNELLTNLNTVAMPPRTEMRYLLWNGMSFVWNTGSGATDWSLITNKPTTLSGYGITANDTLLSNLSGRITSLENKVPVTLQQPILSINNLNRNPYTSENGQILVYRNGTWTYEELHAGGTPGQTSYDDTWIKNWKASLEGDIQNINSTIDQIQNVLNSKLSATKSDVEGWINELLTQYEWWKDNTIVDQIFHESGWSDKLEAYLQQVGVLDSNGNLNYSSITQRIDQIQAQVNALQPGDDGDFEALRAQLNEYIADVNGVKTAVTNMGTKYALLDENQDIIRWLASGFTSQTSQYGSLADMFAATDNAIANVRTSVAEDYTELNQKITKAQSSLSSQITGLDSRTTNLENTVTGTSGLVATVTEIDGYLKGAESVVYSRVEDKLAAFVAKSDLESAVVEMFASDPSSDSTAAILAAVRDGQSTIAMFANAIGIDSTTTTFTGDVMANSFQTGGSGNGIIVLGSAQDSFFNNSISGGSFALHNKAYFYHDGDSMNLAIYNDDESRWYKLDFSSLQLIHGGSYVPKTYYTISYNSGSVNRVIKKILYLNTVDSKYYSDPNSSGALVTGTYYEMNGATNDGYIYTDATTTVNVTNYSCVAFSNGEIVTGPSAPIGGPFYIGTIGGSSKNFVATGTSIIVDNETVYTGAPQSSGTDMTPAGNITWFSNSQTIQP